MHSLLLILGLACSPPIATGEAASALLEALKVAWDPRPQWGDMAIAILEDRAMDPRGGWWPSGGTRYDWDWVRRNFDGDRDGRITAAELPVGDEHFTRLDRDADGVIAELDFLPSFDLGGAAADVFDRFDSDSNGRITRTELEEVFRAADEGALGFLTQEDFAALLAGRTRAHAGATEKRPEPPPAGEPRRPPRLALLWMLFTRQLGSLEEGPAIGDPAPDFLLRQRGSLLGTPLREALGKKPVILVFGSFT